MDKPYILNQQEFQETIALIQDKNTFGATAILRKPEFGFLKMENINVTDGLAITLLSGALSCPLQITADMEGAWVGMLFQLQGNTNSLMDSRGVEVNKGRFNLLKENCETSSHIFIPEQGHFQALNFDLTNDFFLKLLETNEEHFSKLYNLALAKSSFVVSPEALIFGGKINTMLHEVQECPFQGRMKSIFLEAKFIELLTEINARAFNTNRTDVDVFYAVKEFLDKNYNAELHLLQIARQFGINDFKLKKGFKETFGKTVFDYLIEKRLRMAHEIILHTKDPISEISERVGYKNQAYFATAFKKQFGSSPSSLR